MQAIHLIASTGKAGTSIMDAVPHLAGMLMVMVTLAALWGVCALTAMLVRLIQPESKPAAQAAAPAPASKPAAPAAPVPAETGIAPEIVAVIAAAVATVTGNQAHRIVSIKPMSTSWERAGRQSVLTSHRIR